MAKAPKPKLSKEEQEAKQKRMSAFMVGVVGIAAGPVLYMIDASQNVPFAFKDWFFCASLFLTGAANLYEVKNPGSKANMIVRSVATVLVIVAIFLYTR